MTYESNKKWIEPDKRNSDLISDLLKLRNIEDREQFLNPSLDQIHDAALLSDSKTAAKQIKEAIEHDQQIVIHGDFDSDGICATALLWEFLYKEISGHLDKDIKCLPYIPDRVDEGYGLSESSIDAMKAQGAELIITVDCGIRDKELIQKYQTEDLQFIVTDHHQPPADILENLDYTVVHQMYPGKEYPFQEISGTAVVWLLIQVLREEFGLEAIPERGLDLVALSTVTDIMPLRDVNRVFVALGLKQMRNETRPGLSALAKVAKINPKEIEAYHLGFVIGPRINAAGRIGDPIEALRLLVSDNSQNGLKRAAKLNALNSKRQSMTEEILEESRNQLSQIEDDLLYFINGDGWAEGIIGLVAGKITEEFGRPTIVATVNENEARGSARSFGGLNITAALDQFADNLLKYGGHAQAAGFSLDPSKLEEFKKQLVGYVNENFTEEDFIQEIKPDLIADSGDLTVELADKLDLLKPFGYGNKTPLLMLKQMVITNIFPMGADKNHVKLTLKGNDIGFTTAIMFNCKEDIAKLQLDDVIDLLGNISINEWNGNRDVQFMIKEWRKSSL